MRRMALVGILNMSLPSPLLPKTALGSIPLTPSLQAMIAHHIMLTNLLRLLGMVKTGVP